jgi:MFS family permease
VTPLAWLFVLAGLVSLDVRMMPAILPAIAASLGATAGEAGLSMTAYAVTYGLMQVVYGPLSDRYGRIRVIRATAAVFAFGTLSSGLAADLWGFVGARLVTGMFAAAVIPTTFVYIGDTVHYAHRQKVVARFASVFSRRRRCRPPSRAR